jgi:predicted nucleic acid-binding protein
MKGKVLVDTNILVYAYDLSEKDKQRRAAEILNELYEMHTGVLSPQILSEFFVVVTRKLQRPLKVTEAISSIENYISSWEVVEINTFTVLEAIRGVRVHRFSYWDSLVWATARMNQIPVVLSEDFSHNSTVEGIRFINPFVSELPFA